MGELSVLHAVAEAACGVPGKMSNLNKFNHKNTRFNNYILSYVNLCLVENLNYDHQDNSIILGFVVPRGQIVTKNPLAVHTYVCTIVPL